MLATLLLSAAALALTTSTRATALLGDDAALVARAQSLASERLELDRARPSCAAPAGSPRNLPRIVATTQRSAAPGVERTRLLASLTLSPFASSAPVTLSLSSAKECE